MVIRKDLKDRGMNYTFRRSFLSFTGLLAPQIAGNILLFSGAFEEQPTFEFSLVVVDIVILILTIWKLYKRKLVIIQGDKVEIHFLLKTVVFNKRELLKLEKDSPINIKITLSDRKMISLNIFDLNRSDREKLFVMLTS
jgi:hypothetical protein